MPWIAIKTPAESRELADTMRRAMANYPADYTSPERRAMRRVHPLVAKHSIAVSHSLLPKVLEPMFQAYGAMLDPALPLSRREHELIAATVSGINDCFY